MTQNNETSNEWLKKAQQSSLEINPNDIATANKGKKMGSYILISLSAKWFYPVYELSLWLILGFGVIFGGITGYNINYHGSVGGAFLGIIIGTLLSLCYIIIFTGILSIFLKMNENIEKLVKNKN